MQVAAAGQYETLPGLVYVHWIRFVSPLEFIALYNTRSELGSGSRQPYVAYPLFLRSSMRSRPGHSVAPL